MNDQQKKEPKEPLRIPLDFEETLADMLKIKPPPDNKPDKTATYNAMKDAELIRDIMALPDNVVISYDYDGKHYAYTAEYWKRAIKALTRRNNGIRARQEL